MLAGVGSFYPKLRGKKYFLEILKKLEPSGLPEAIFELCKISCDNVSQKKLYQRNQIKSETVLENFVETSTDKQKKNKLDLKIEPPPNTK